MTLFSCFLNKESHMFVLHHALKMTWSVLIRLETCSLCLLCWARSPFWNLMGKTGFSSALTIWGGSRAMAGSPKYSCRPGGKEMQLSVQMDGGCRAASSSLILRSPRGLGGPLPAPCPLWITLNALWAGRPWGAAGVQADRMDAPWAGEKIPINQCGGTSRALVSRPLCGLVLKHLTPETFWFPSGIFLISMIYHDKCPKRLIAQLITSNKLIIAFFCQYYNHWSCLLVIIMTDRSESCEAGIKRSGSS